MRKSWIALIIGIALLIVYIIAAPPTLYYLLDKYVFDFKLPASTTYWDYWTATYTNIENALLCIIIADIIPIVVITKLIMSEFLPAILLFLAFPAATFIVHVLRGTNLSNAIALSTSTLIIVFLWCVLIANLSIKEIEIGIRHDERGWVPIGQRIPIDIEELLMIIGPIVITILINVYY